MCACGVRQLVAAGAEVVAGSRDPEKAGRGEIPAGVRLVKCDVRDQKALAEALAAEAPYDILISSATGGERAIGPFMTMDMEGFQASFDKLWGYTNIVVRTAPCWLSHPQRHPQRPRSAPSTHHRGCPALTPRPGSATAASTSARAARSRWSAAPPPASQSPARSRWPQSAHPSSSSSARSPSSSHPRR